MTLACSGIPYSGLFRRTVCNLVTTDHRGLKLGSHRSKTESQAQVAAEAALWLRDVVARCCKLVQDVARILRGDSMKPTSFQHLLSVPGTDEPNAEVVANHEALQRICCIIRCLYPMGKGNRGSREILLWHVMARVIHGGPSRLVRCSAEKGLFILGSSACVHLRC